MSSTGDTLHGRYRVTARIGEGGMGTVFLADDLRLPGRRCAVKEIRLPEGARAPDLGLRALFAQEAAVLARLDHPALPKVSDHFDSGGRDYLVMDYVPGQDLRALVDEARSRGRWLDVGQVMRWAEALCSALTYLHRQDPPVLHRDVKPANVKLTPDGQVRLVDFGLALVEGAPEGRTGTLVTEGGSLAYRPLEQQGGGEIDARADVYALGATIYHLLTGRPPAPAQARFLEPGRFVPPRQLRPELTANAEAAVVAAMALHPDQRPRSAEALRQILVGPAASGQAGGPATDWQHALRANAWLLAVVITLLLAAAALSL